MLRASCLMKNYFIKTYGCQMNVNDSEAIAGMLEQAGYEGIRGLGTGDWDIGKLGIILVNTCCVRESAENKAIGFIYSLKSIKMQNPDLIIGVCGCIPNEQHIDLKKRFPFVDLIFGPNEKRKLSDFLGLNGCNIQPKRERSVTAFITIMEGCDNFCSYCVVPHVRGRERSRPAQDIIEEIRGLDKSLFKEVVLLGQNVNSYQGEETSNGSRVTSNGLAKLLEDIHGIDGIERIRFLTSHPRDMSDDIIDAVKELPKVCEYFHLPLQSGDDQILKAMNRGYTSDHYRKLVEKIRKKIPEASITSDAIAGFPGETDEQFENTLKLISELELDLVNTFTYSPRPGTAAEKLPGQIPEEVRSQRLRRLMDVVKGTAGRRNKRLAGTIQEVLVERKKQNRLSGRTRGNTLVKFESEKDLIGKTVKVRITAPAPFVLEGELVS